MQVDYAEHYRQGHAVVGVDLSAIGIAQMTEDANATALPSGRVGLPSERVDQRGDGRVVQHGIVRIDLSLLPPKTASAIRAESAPLGRILLAAGLLCDVHAEQLLRIIVGPGLAGLFKAAVGTETYGRVATIGLYNRPVIELLEISAPVSGSDRAASG